VVALVVYQEYPQVENVELGVLVVGREYLIKDVYTKEQVPALWEKWLADYSKLEQAFKNDMWNPKPSGLCRRHCAVTECAHNGRN